MKGVQIRRRVLRCLEFFGSAIDHYKERRG